MLAGRLQVSFPFNRSFKENGMTDTREPGSDGADAKAKGNGQAQERAQPPILIQAQYLKDLSFEAPGAPGIFSLLQKNKPDIQIRVDVHANTLAENSHEVILHLRADCKVADSVAFVVELSYAGLFTLNVPDEHRRPVLMIECPRLLFPYARKIVADATLEGGFLPLMLAPLDFVQLYQRQQPESTTEKSVAGTEEEIKLV